MTVQTSPTFGFRAQGQVAVVDDVGAVVRHDIDPVLPAVGPRIGLEVFVSLYRELGNERGVARASGRLSRGQ